MTYKASLKGRIWHRLMRISFWCRHFIFKCKELIFGIRKGAVKTLTFETKLKITINAYENLNSKYKEGFEIIDEIENDIEWLLAEIQFKRNMCPINKEVIDVDYFVEYEEDGEKKEYRGLKATNWGEKSDLILKDGKLYFGWITEELDEFKRI